jgi:Fe-S cluster assembly protein SufD
MRTFLPRPALAAAFLAGGCRSFPDEFFTAIMNGVTTSSSTSFDAADFTAFLQSRQDPEWLLDERRQAWQRYEGMAWPQRDEEEWRRTDIRLFKLPRFRSPLDVQPAPTLPAGLLTEGVKLGGQVVSFNGTTQREFLDDKWARKKVWFSSMDQLTAEQFDVLRPHLMRRIVDPAGDRFAALHAAWWNGGRVLYVPRGVVLDEPVHSLSVLGSLGSDLGRTLIVVEDGAEATVLIETASSKPDDEGFHCGATEVVVGRGANLRLVNLQDWGHRTWHFAHQKALVGQDASLQWTIAALGSRLSKVNQHVALQGPGATCQVNGVMFTEGSQHISYHTLQHHEVPSCRSDFLYKAALQDKSRTVWRGMIKVDPAAQKTDGYQRNDNLLLSPDARADSIPGLEIEADDVRCTHGSTSGRVDEELIFYARCRGFTRKEAIRAVVIGFFQQVFDRITIESVREALGAAIARRVREYQ